MQYISSIASISLFSRVIPLYKDNPFLLLRFQHSLSAKDARQLDRLLLCGENSPNIYRIRGINMNNYCTRQVFVSRISGKNRISEHAVVSWNNILNNVIFTFHLMGKRSIMIYMKNNSNKKFLVESNQKYGDIYHRDMNIRERTGYTIKPFPLL